jgi:hypothetical protein
VYPNSALTAWQFAAMIIVVMTGLAAWLTAVYLAAREPRGHAGEASLTQSPAAHHEEKQPESRAA